MKNLSDIQQDMSTLYDEFKSGTVEREAADSLANIAGKFLKAEQLKLARDIFEAEFPARLPSASGDKKAKRLAASS